MSGMVTTAHVARLDVYEDSSMGFTEYEPRGVPIPLQPRRTPHRRAARHKAYPLRCIRGVGVHWKGFSASEKSWEPLATLYRDALAYVLKKLNSLKLPLATRKAILRRHDVRLIAGAGARLPSPTNVGQSH